MEIKRNYYNYSKFCQKISIFALVKLKKKGRNMSTAALEGLVTYLYGTLSPSDMRWVARHLNKQADEKEKDYLHPKSLEEMKAQLLRAKRDFDAGLGIPHEEVMREWEEELEREEQLEMELAEAV